MKTFAASIVSMMALVSLALPASAQTTSPQGVPNLTGQDSGSVRDQFNKLQEYDYRAKRLFSAEDKNKGKTLAQVLAEDKAATVELVKAMPLSCEVSDAMKVAEGTAAASDGKTVSTATYEVSCANGLGYFLVSRGAEKPDGFSCFAADATRAADLAAGRKPGIACQLPANAKIKEMATQALAKAGATCAVRDYRLVGQNVASHLEFNEFACSDGKGYILISAVPGSQSPATVETCHDSAVRGLPCKMSDNGVMPLSLQTFRDFLAKKSVACNATDNTMRVVGQETKSKRHVVEFQCPQQPKGLVAFIPLSDSTAAFETMDCPTAKQTHGVSCALNK